SPPDLSLYKVTDSVDAAVDEVLTFYRVYHSMRYVQGDLVLRLRHRLAEALLERVRTEVAGILVSGTFEQTAALPAQANDTPLAPVPALKSRSPRRSLGRLRQLIDLINAAGSPGNTGA